MFEDKKQPQAAAPVEDMFSGTDAPVTQPSPSPASLLTPPPAAPSAGIPTQSADSAMPHAAASAGVHHTALGPVKVLLILVVVLLLVAGAAYGAYQVMVRQPSGSGIVQSVPDNGVVEGGAIGADEDDAPVASDDEDDQEDSTSRPTILDSDGDGLTNAEELDAGTLANNPDSDSDGLGDREEVKVYETDPRDADTDNDSFLDGQEVAGGYNPNGEGRLFQVPESE